MGKRLQQGKLICVKSPILIVFAQLLKLYETNFYETEVIPILEHAVSLNRKTK